MAKTVVFDMHKFTFKAPLPGHFLGQFLVKNIATDTSAGRSITPSVSLSPTNHLDLLPIEIKLRIVSILDLCTICDLRLVNSSFRKLVDSNLDFKIVQPFPKLLASICILKCRYYTLETLAAAVCDNHCSRCENYGDYLYLLTAERLCYYCFRELPDYVPKAIESPSPSMVSALETKVPLAAVPPGNYGMYGRACVARPQMVTDRRALQLLRQLLSTKEQQLGEPHMQDDSFDDSEPETTRRRYLNRTSLNHTLPWDKAPLPARYTIVLPAPYWDPETQEYHEGVFCRACVMSAETQSHPPRWRNDSYFWDYPYRRYTGEQGIRKHFEECGPVQEVVVDDGTVTKYVHESLPSRNFARPDEVCRSAAAFNRYQDKNHYSPANGIQPALEATMKGGKTGNVFGPQHKK